MFINWIFALRVSLWPTNPSDPLDRKWAHTQGSSQSSLVNLPAPSWITALLNLTRYWGLDFNYVKAHEPFAGFNMQGQIYKTDKGIETFHCELCLPAQWTGTDPASKKESSQNVPHMRNSHSGVWWLVRLRQVYVLHNNHISGPLLKLWSGPQY